MALDFIFRTFRIGTGPIVSKVDTDGTLAGNGT